MQILHLPASSNFKFLMKVLKVLCSVLVETQVKHSSVLVHACDHSALYWYCLLKVMSMEVGHAIRMLVLVMVQNFHDKIKLKNKVSNFTNFLLLLIPVEEHNCP